MHGCRAVGRSPGMMSSSARSSLLRQNVNRPRTHLSTTFLQPALQLTVYSYPTLDRCSNQSQRCIEHTVCGSRAPLRRRKFRTRRPRPRQQRVVASLGRAIWVSIFFFMSLNLSVSFRRRCVKTDLSFSCLQFIPRTVRCTWTERIPRCKRAIFSDLWSRVMTDNASLL